MSSWRRALCTVLLSSLALSAQAALVIDNFTGLLNLNLPAGGTNPTGVSGGNLPGVANVLGGARNASLTRTDGSGTSRLSIDSDVAGALRFATDASAVAGILLRWDGNTDNVLNHVLNVDLTGSGQNDRFQAAVRANAAVTATITVYSGAGNFSVLDFATPGGGTALPFTILDLVFSAFTVGGGTGANFSAVTAITLGLAGPQSFEAQFDFLQADAAPNPIPEPSSAALLLAGLALTGWLMRRRT